MLVGGIPTPLKNMTSSVGMMKFPIYGTKNVPNHQPGCYNPTIHSVVHRNPNSSHLVQDFFHSPYVGLTVITSPKLKSKGMAGNRHGN